MERERQRETDILDEEKIRPDREREREGETDRQTDRQNEIDK